jgi:outer membrane protein assembly factor BamB
MEKLNKGLGKIKVCVCLNRFPTLACAFSKSGMLDEPLAGRRRAHKSHPPARWLRLVLLALVSLPLPARADFELTNEWTMVIGAVSDCCPAIAPDGTIYLGTWDARLLSLTKGGALKWIFRAGLEIKSSPAVGTDGRIFFGSRDRNFYCLNPDGTKSWEFLTGGWVDSSPALGTNGTIYFGSWDKTFYALKTDGSLAWKYKTDGQIVSSPAIGLDGTVYFGSHDKKFYSFEPAGRKKWEYSTGSQIISSPAVNKDQCVYFSSVDGYFYALNLDGTLRWRLRTGGISESSPVIGPDGVIYVGVNTSLWAIMPDGKQKWDRYFADWVESSPVFFANRTLCCVARGGELIGMKEDKGFSWRAILGGFAYGSPAVASDGTLYAAGASKNFSAITGGVPLGQTPWPKFRGNLRNTGNASDNQP